MSWSSRCLNDCATPNWIVPYSTQYICSVRCLRLGNQTGHTLISPNTHMHQTIHTLISTNIHMPRTVNSYKFLQVWDRHLCHNHTLCTIRSMDCESEIKSPWSQEYYISIPVSWWRPKSSFQCWRLLGTLPKWGVQRNLFLLFGPAEQNH